MYFPYKNVRRNKIFAISSKAHLNEKTLTFTNIKCINQYICDKFW